MAIVKRIPALLLVLLSLSSHGGSPTHAASQPDTTALQPGGPSGGGPEPPKLLFSHFDTVRTQQYLMRHAYSLDNFLEVFPRYFMGRRGPIGAEAAFSRYSIGQSRGALFLGSVRLNDPQNDLAPLAMVPTTAIGRMVLDIDASLLPTFQSNIEGAVKIVEPRPPTKYPSTAFELSKGDRDLNHARVRFSTVQRSIGLDFSYDELRDSGYYFDARGVVPSAPDYGRSTTRVRSLSLRGTARTADEYMFSFRQFNSSFTGDLVDAAAATQRHGHLGVLEGTVAAFQLAAFDRGYTVDAPDSMTSNETISFSVSTPIVLGENSRIWMGLTYQDILSKQEIGGATSTDNLREGGIGINGTTSFRRGIGGRFGLNVAHHLDGATGWGGHLNLVGRLGSRNSLSLRVKRGFRMPNLGELFLPDHLVADSTTAGGNADVDPETSLEGAVGLYSRYGVLENEVRALAIRINNPIRFAPTGTGGSTLVLRPRNEERGDLAIIEDRFRIAGTYWGINLRLLGGVEAALGDRVGYFESVPGVRLNAAFAFGRAFFQNTSELYITAEYNHTGSRMSGGVKVPAFDVINFKLDIRLIDAQIYAMWLNALDEKYVTVWPYLMTPRTFVFGIQWTLFD